MRRRKRETEDVRALSPSLRTPLTEETILKIFGFPDHYKNRVRSFECRGLRLLTGKFVANFGDSRDNVFEMYGDSRENLFEVLAVVIILSSISSVGGTHSTPVRALSPFLLTDTLNPHD